MRTPFAKFFFQGLKEKVEANRLELVVELQLILGGDLVLYNNKVN